MQQQPPMHHHHPDADHLEPRMAVPPPLPPSSRLMADFFSELELLVHKYNVRAHEEIGLPIPENVKLKVVEEDAVGKKRRRARKDPNAPKKPKTTYFLFMDDARTRMVPYIKQHIPDVLLKDITRVAAAIWREDVHAEEKARYIQLYDNLKNKFMHDSKAFKERKEQQQHQQQQQQQYVPGPPLPAPTTYHMMDMHSPMKDVHPHGGYGVPVVDNDEEEPESDDEDKSRKKKNRKKKQPYLQ